MPDGVIIIKRPRAVVRGKMSTVTPALPTLFNEILNKDEWSEGENEFMQSHLDPVERVADWHEDI